MLEPAPGPDFPFLSWNILYFFSIKYSISSIIFQHYLYPDYIILFLLKSALNMELTSFPILFLYFNQHKIVLWSESLCQHYFFENTIILTLFSIIFYFFQHHFYFFQHQFYFFSINFTIFSINFTFFSINFTFFSINLTFFQHKFYFFQHQEYLLINESYFSQHQIYFIRQTF